MDSYTSVKPLIEQIANMGSGVAANSSLQPEVRRKLQNLAKELGFALETPWDTLSRLSFLPLQYKIVRVAIDLGLFEYFIEAGPEGRTVEDIVAKTRVDELLLPSLGIDTTLAGLFYSNLQIGLEIYAREPVLPLVDVVNALSQQ
ncbi:MAG: hypothetical protein LQ343_000481 [Gyalolechia ehrenbergii]|nr:MAG: hypothetical protein LQ343_000481 [Gyalolechia ehrenbergii]